MYKALVRFRTRLTLRRLSNGELDKALTVFGPSSVFCFYGNHALGGELRGPAGARAFFERTFRLFPGITIEPVRIAVNGWPWSTLLCTRFRIRARLADGSDYRNEGMQYARLRWGKVVEDRLFEDTQALVDALAIVARLGNDEATAAPLGPRPTDSAGIAQVSVQEPAF
jgi:ketosteroid isomerase-like protein